ncbi:transcriptional regulator, TetR family [Catenulispora acidiphila DSM 44928]|uniref:Transcriptional regulator, TetR family n=2 Tax=Catenulispora TaxID=414878 RepID=C7QDC1_CATAD|nr:transcriptional regulator, TetR family [Catenulispora acidiphila DSM 44928]
MSYTSINVYDTVSMGSVVAMTESRAHRREEAILLAAMGLLGDVGYDRMSIDGVAERAHASKATIYRRWPGKAELVAEAVRRYARSAIALPPEGASLREDLLAVLGSLRANLAEQDAALVLGLLLAMRHDAELARTVRQNVLDYKREVFAAVLARAAARGDIPETADCQLAAEISSAVLVNRLLVTDEPLDDAFLARFVDTVLLPTLQARPAQPNRPAGPLSQ